MQPAARPSHDDGTPMSTSSDPDPSLPSCPACGSRRTVELGSDEHATIRLCRDCDVELEVPR